MAEENSGSVGDAVVPPKVNPLASPAAPHAETVKTATPAPVVKKPATLSGLKPGIKLPPKPGATVSALRPGIKLPPKPGATVSALRPGIKLPPKPGATVSALRPGIKLPPKPGATVSALRPGIKLPPKPGATAAKVAPSKPAAPAPVAATPAPAPAPATPAPAPAAPAAPVAVAPSPAPAPAPAPAPTEANAETVKPLEQLKAVTQNLKSITTPIPQQAILRKTGVIADAEVTEAQKQAAKSKTARISLSDAMGIAPVKSEALPMKTIRIKRPLDIPAAGSPGTVTKPTMAPVAAPAAPTNDTVSAKPVNTDTATAPSTGNTTTFTQRKTIKITRPGGSVRPSGKFGLKKPATPTKPAGASPENATVPDMGAVADIPDIPTVAAMPAPAVTSVGDTVSDVPKAVGIVSILVQIAACLAVAALAWMLYQDAQIPQF